MSRESEIQRKMQQKLENARKHQGCSPGNCIVGKMDECQYQEPHTDPKTGQQVSNPVTDPPDHTIPCPECGGALDTLEVSYGRGVTENGIWVTEGGDRHTDIEFTDPMDSDVKTVGAMCSDCDWQIERPDWFEYLKDYEANEIARIKAEFEAVKRGDDTRTSQEKRTAEIAHIALEAARGASSRTWPVDLVPGNIKIIIPVQDNDPIEMTLDMDEMDGPTDIHVDPDKRTVSFESEEFEEVTE